MIAPSCAHESFVENCRGCLWKWHGCNTGDCPHWDKGLCEKQLAKDFRTPGILEMFWCMIFHRKPWVRTGFRRLKIAYSMDYHCLKCGQEHSELEWDVGVM